MVLLWLVSNTFTGSNTFSSTVSLGSSASATTQAITDNDTSVATTAFARMVSTHQPISTLSRWYGCSC